MTLLKLDSRLRKGAITTYILGLFFFGIHRGYAGEVATPEKIAPTIKLSYKISNGEKSIRAAVSTPEDGKSVPVRNLIVNLYLTSQKKYDPSEGDGWIGNHVTDNNGHVDFFLPLKVSNLNNNSHEFFFIASIGSDPVFKDTRESIKLIDAAIELTFEKIDNEISVIAKLMQIKENSPLVLPQKEIKLFLKRGGEEIAFGEEQLMTDANGMVSAILDADMIDNENKTITIVARYEDLENNGLIEASKDMPLKIIENKQGLLSWLKGAPMTFVVVLSMMLIMLIFFFKVKKKQ